MSDFQFNLTEALLRAAAIIRTRLELQVPVKTGRLRDSINVYVDVDNQDVNVEYEEYGTYTNYGTGDGKNGLFGQGIPPGRFVGYNEFKGGIQAQNWTSISLDDEVQIDKIIEEEIIRKSVEALDKEIAAI